MDEHYMRKVDLILLTLPSTRVSIHINTI